VSILLRSIGNGLDRIGAGLDRTIGLFSPRSELTRRLDRMQAAKVRQYAAAKVTRLTGDWIPANQDVNSLIRTSSPIIRARSRQLVRDFPFFARAVNVLVNFTVGSGIQYQAQIKKSDGTFNKRINQQIEDAIKWGMDELDAAGKLHGDEMERLAKRQDVESGECLLVKTMLPDANRYTPLAYLQYEADWLSSNYAEINPGNVVDQGIEYDPTTGRVAAYHFAVPNGYNGITSITASTKPERIAAERVIHNFDILRPGQLRGISPFTTAILIAHDLGDYLDATMDVAKIASKYLAFVTTNDAVAFQMGRTSNDPNSSKKLEEVENAIIEYLRPGEQVQFANHNMPGDQFPAFTKFVLRMVAVATGITYELLTSDYDGISYSNLKGIRNDFIACIRPQQQRHIRHISLPIRREIITAAVLSGKLTLPGYFLDPRKYWAGACTAPGMESPDPLREGKAWIEQVMYCLRSPQEIAAARGRTLEEILDEIQEADRMMKERDLHYQTVNLGSKNNPAALGATEEGNTGNADSKQQKQA